MTNPTWQPGPPKEAGWFWILHDPFIDPDQIPVFVQIRDLHEDLWPSLISRDLIKRHAGPVAIPEPVEPREATE